MHGGAYGADETVNIFKSDAAGERKANARGSRGDCRRANGAYRKTGGLQLSRNAEREFVATENHGDNLRGARSIVEARRGQFCAQGN